MDQRITDFLKKNKELFLRPVDKIQWGQVYKLALGEFRIYLGKFTEFWLNKDIHPEYYLTELPYYFLHRSHITNFHIPNNIITIGNSAFEDCTSLTSVTIGDGVTEINRQAFYDCTSLTSVTIGNGVKSIGFEAFHGCKNLTSIEIPSSVTSIDTGAFLACSSLTNVYINDIAAWCNISFSNWSSNPMCYQADLYLNGSLITDLVIPNSVTRIGDRMFSGCSSLESVTIPNSVTEIGDSTFRECTSLTSITIPDSVTSIDKNAFAFCSSLTSVTIPNSVTWIGGSAFYNCNENIVINYSGTKAQFETLIRGKVEDTYFTAHCTDGDIVKKKR